MLRQVGSLVIAILSITAAEATVNTQHPSAVFRHEFAPVLEILKPETVLIQHTAVNINNASADFPICTSSVLVDYNIGSLKKKVIFTNPTRYQKSFSANMFTLHKIAQEVSEGTRYDDAYRSENILLTFGLMIPSFSKDIKLRFLSEFERSTRDLKHLIDRILPQHNRYQVNDLLNCDKKVSDIVRRNPNLRKAAQLIIELGRLTLVYKLKHETEMDEAIKNHQEHKYWAEGKQHLRRLIEQNSVIYDLLDSSFY